jgi:hypothetical protein
MTTIRTDLIPNLFANPIKSVSKASPAVVTVPVTTTIVSTTGTIGTVTGSGTDSAPWLATITLMSSVAGLVVGNVITATASTGTFAAGGSVSVNSIVGNQSIQIRKVGGTIPTAGTITNITLPAVSTLPVFLANANIVSTTGTIGTVTGSGSSGTPWTAAITLMSSVVGLQVGDVITATAGSGDFAAGGSVTVAAILGTNSIQINKVGGTIPTAGTVTNITIPRGTIVLFTNPGNKFTFSSSTGTFQAGETFTQATSGATGLITNVLPLTVEYTVTSGVVDTTNLVTGATSGATATPASVTGMNQLLTAGINNTNAFYISVLSANTFSLYKDAALSTAVDSSAFTTYTTNAGQYTDFSVTVITSA